MSADAILTTDTPTTAPSSRTWVQWAKSKRRDYQVFDRFSRTERIGIVKQGLPANVLVTLATDMDVPRELVFSWLGIPRATANRKVRLDTVLSQDESERALGITRIVGQVGRIVRESGNPEGFDAARWTAAWLERPSRPLGGRRPGEFMDTADGRALVSGLVAQMQSGAYA